jgi:uncharacterized protein (DUF302 family)
MTILARSARRLTLVATLALIPHLGAAFEPRDGWRVVPTPHDYATLNTRIEAAVEASEIRIVTQASASAGAAQQKITIPGNRVIGLYRNDYARRMLAASLAAGIEAPIRLYVTENADGTATVSYKLPSTVFAPYMDEGGADLAALAAELDQIFQSVTDQAAGN